MTYSGCQKNVPLFEGFFLQPLIPPFRISERIFEKRYKFKNPNIWALDIGICILFEIWCLGFGA